MPSTDVLTFGQGVRIMVEILVFLILYFIFLKITASDNMIFTNLVITTGMFALWAFTVTIMSNISMSLSIPVSREASISPYDPEDEPL